MERRAFSAPLRGAIASAMVLGAVALGAGCGETRPPPAGDAVPGAPVGGANGFAQDAGSTLPPGCGVKDDGSYCDCLDAPLFIDAPNIYFVLDRSGSMAEDDKWDQVRVTVAKVLRSVGERANFAATMFPGGSNADTCAPGEEIMPLRPGDPPSGSVDGPTTKILLDATNVTPNGGTPTASTLQYVLSRVSLLSGKTFLILATDGGPNCNAQVNCDSSQCITNIESAPGCPPNGAPNCCVPPDGTPQSCLDSTPTIAAVTALEAAGFPTYVVGIPGSAPYSSLLDQLAVAGGTATSISPKYFRVDTTSQTELLLTLQHVAAKIVATCTFTLKEAPKDPTLVNVYLDEVVLPQDPVNGWKIDGTTVTLLGDACNRVESGDVLDVRIITGCPTVAPH